MTHVTHVACVRESAGLDVWGNDFGFNDSWMIPYLEQFPFKKTARKRVSPCELVGLVQQLLSIGTPQTTP